MTQKKYNFKEYHKHSNEYKFIITEDGHTMMPEDIARRLNERYLLLEKVRKLEKEIKELKK